MRAERLWEVALFAMFLGGCASAAQPIAPAAPPPPDVALQAELAEKNEEVDSLRAEIDRLRQRETDLTTELKQALRSTPGKTISDRPAADAEAVSEATIRELQDALNRERAHRQQLEEQLARLKRETSSPPIPLAAAPAPASPTTADAEPPSPIAAIPAPPRPIVEIIVPPELKAAPPPTDEPAKATAGEPKPPPALASAPPEAPLEPEAPLAPEPPPPGREAPPPSKVETQEIAALRARAVDQETRHQEAMSSLARVLDADRRRQEDLEAELVALRSGAPGTEGAVAADSTELNHLRTRLEEERRRNAELTAKLKLASRVTDLVFRMQNQDQQAPAYPPRTELSQTEPGANAPDQPYVDPRGNVNQPIAPEVPEVDGAGAAAVPEVGGPDSVEIPPVFENQGPDVVEEVTQD